MKRILLSAFAAVMALGSFAQRTCGTVDVHNRLLQADPTYAANRQRLEQFTQNYVNSGAFHNQRSLITIPVVVHVIYHDSVGNISLAQIQSQITRLNLDYQKLNADTSLIPAPWKSIAANCQIQFCLAQRDPNNMPTTGVRRVRTSVTSWLDNDAIKYAAQGGDDAWPADSYLNIWVCDLGNSLLGYSQFPGGAAATDGCVILNTAFGSTGSVQAPFNKGRTVTHEVGHWLNLFHIWGDDGGACTGSDNVNDTPNSGNANYNCPTYPLLDACATTSPGAMFMNYMDYVDDACMYMFTNGQNARIQANFANGGPRAAMLNSLGCVPVGGGPFAGFAADQTNICAGDFVTFTNASYDTPTVFHWSFPGGSPDTSSLETPPIVFYNIPGTYPVTLTVQKDTSSNTKTISSYITVKGTTPLPLAEGFEGGTFPPTGWTISNPDGSTAWDAASTGSSSQNSAYLDNYTVTNRGAYDYLYTPVLDFSTGIDANSKLKFDYAYGIRRTNNRDSLIVIVSTDCGKTWNTLWAHGGGTLATTTTNTGNVVYSPAATDWVSDSSISLANLAGETSVQFGFVNYSAHGNAVYLDNINIYVPTSVNTGVNDISNNVRLNVIPNPTTGRCVIRIDMNQAADVSLTVVNTLGQQIWTRDMGTVKVAGESLDLSGLAQGVYLVHVKAGDKSYTTRIIKE